MKKRNVLSPIRKCNTECHYFPNAMSVCMEYLERDAADRAEYPATFVGVWPLPEGTYDPALDGADIPEGAGIFGLFGEGYVQFEAPGNVDGMNKVSSPTELKYGSYCVLNASSGFGYILVNTDNPDDVPVKMRERTKYDYAFISGMSGSAFSAIWKDFRDCPSEIAQFVPDWLEPAERAFRSCGYEPHFIVATSFADAEKLYKKHVVESIDKGLPVLATSLVSVPVFRAYVGYDDYGDTLLGTNFFDNFFKDALPDGEYPNLFAHKRSDWKNHESYVITLFSEKRPGIDIADKYKEALKWAVTVHELEKVPSNDNVYCGNAAIRKCADDLLEDIWFPSNDKNALWSSLDSFGGFISNMYGRYRTGEFIRRAVEFFLDASAELEQAASLYDEIWNITKQIYCPDPDGETEHIFATREKREYNSSLLKQIAKLDTRAVCHIKSALTTIGSKKTK